MPYPKMARPGMAEIDTSDAELFYDASEFEDGSYRIYQTKPGTFGSDAWVLVLNGRHAKQRAEAIAAILRGE
jgi:hypothetical protein